MRETLITICIICCCTGILYSQDKAKSDSATAAMMKKYIEATSAGKHHTPLAEMVGKWTTETSLFMGPPPTPPITSKGTAEMSLLFDGRFLKQESNGQMMGRPYTGMGITGYDNVKKCYLMSWIDNLSTAISSAEGNYDMSGKVLTMYGKMDEPMTGEQNLNAKYVLRKIDDDKFVFEIHNLTLGEPNTRIVEITYTRVK